MENVWLEKSIEFHWTASLSKRRYRRPSPVHHSHQPTPHSALTLIPQVWQQQGRSQLLLWIMILCCVEYLIQFIPALHFNKFHSIRGVYFIFYLLTNALTFIMPRKYNIIFSVHWIIFLWFCFYSITIPHFPHAPANKRKISYSSRFEWLEVGHTVEQGIIMFRFYDWNWIEFQRFWYINIRLNS